MEILRDTLSWILLVSGGLVAIASGIGLLRLPDLYTRMHAAGMLDSLGALCILAGLALQSGASLVTFKLALLYAFLLLTTATASHVLGKSALRSGLAPLQGAWPPAATDGGANVPSSSGAALSAAPNHTPSNDPA